MFPQVFIGPMSKNVVDVAKEYNIGFICSRRQIDYNSGYVNNWTTSSFSAYIKSYNKNILIARDHGGPHQGAEEDDGYASLQHDINYFDILHIDPWKKITSFSDGVEETIKMIHFCYKRNNNILFEVGTEEAIKRFTAQDLHTLLHALESNLSRECFSRIVYAVVQSGTALQETRQIGSYDRDRLLGMLDVTKRYNKQSKEHNGDYIPAAIIREKFNCGLSAINIAPEFGVIETSTYIKLLSKDDIEVLFNICFTSNKWQKWVTDSFNPIENKIELIKICAHYIFNTAAFKDILSKYDHIEEIARRSIALKINELTGP